MGARMCVRVLFKGREIATRPLDRDLIVIGRDPQCGVRLDNPAVSRHHARIERRGDEYILRDLGSENGTHIHDEPILSLPVRPGTRVQISKFELYFDVLDAPLPSKAADPVEFVPGVDDAHTIQVTSPKTTDRGRKP